MDFEKLAGYLDGKTGIANAELRAKDALLQNLLIELAGNGYFRDNFVFKGGTCLVKAYFGYYRFSEDLDFSWIKQGIYAGKSGKQVRRIISKEIDRMLELISKASEKLGLDFKPQKHNRRYVEIGGSNRLVTLKLWRKPSGRPEGFIKIQVNFEEKFFHPFLERELKPVFDVKDKKELKVLFPAEAYILLEKPKMKVYGLREIAAEKVRAILTRKGVKARDFIDLYYLSKQGILVENVEKEAIAKTRDMLRYMKYADNMLLKGEALGKFDIEKERYLLVGKMGDDFRKFSEEMTPRLIRMIHELGK
ncbi:MAG: nucleotidyl transferase AbiEii/AbiGii toxin family protein [Candidatus Micrarchaeia archaeon]|jgi:predicted nucleotidyltransferase component of viral defense system